jgi:hypothetical protein
MLTKLLLALTTLYLTKSQLCGNQDPSTIDDCLSGDSDSNYCCLGELNYNSTFKYLCLLIPKNVSFILPYMQDINLPGNYEIDVKLNCGNRVVDTSPPICGNPYPQKLSDCSAFNSDTSYCCLFKAEGKNNSLCIDSKNLVAREDELFGYVIQCEAGRKIYFSLIAILIYVLLIL